MNLRDYFDLPGSMSQAAMAEALGCHYSQVSQWVRGVDGRVPGPYYCVRIEALTKGLVTCEELHPDAGWQRLTNKALGPWPHHAEGFPAINPELAAVR